MVCSNQENIYLVILEKRYMLHAVVQEKLIVLEKLLFLKKRFPVIRPSSQAMSSQAPFAVDTMSFEQWLQYLFLPQMRQLIRQQSQLPRQMGLAPMAEHQWGNDPELNGLINIFQDFDALFDETH
ncbi:YqcC family protein [Shewanella surugensis]|uniref:YqcC family protein n=1 Tax=Shewanella surugensis TaxID=212020 RepID=A0ABT0LGU4_9GAMM|nr:YqcC family protein [Shewanella surugensis]MCL1126675.1 YqcC family protein [Shewanella surugensis]